MIVNGPRDVGVAVDVAPVSGLDGATDEGGTEVVVVGSSPVTVKANVADAVAGGLAESVTWKVTDDAKVCAGTPEIVPVEVSRLSPVGSEPEVIFQVRVPVPPIALSGAVYG